MSEEGLSLHPYDILAHPKRRRILGFLAGTSCSYSELMKETGIEDSGSLSYHLGVLSRYIRHEKNLYSLSIDGKVLWGALQEFEKRSYGLVGSITASGIVHPEGTIKISYSMKFSMMTPEGDMLERKQDDKFDSSKADAHILSKAGKPGLAIQGVSTEWDEDGVWITFKQEIRGYEEKDGWMVDRSPPDLASTEFEGESMLYGMVPGLHMQVRGSTLYPEGAIVEREYPDKDALEQKGIEVYQLSVSQGGHRWRVQKGAVLCLGESRLEKEGRFTRGITEIETHVLVKGEDPELIPQIRKDVRTLPGLVSGKSRYRIAESGKVGEDGT